MSDKEDRERKQDQTQIKKIFCLCSQRFFLCAQPQLYQILEGDFRVLRDVELEPDLSWNIISPLNSHLLHTSISDLIAFYQIASLECTNFSNH